ncbi:MAG: transcriptional regulator, AraC family [Mucilaginibacter sp.]|nr:transcriptional regulator, AraC family [Mucilaginibacter sp.]
MVCISCQMVVRYELEKLGLNNSAIKAGQVELLEPISIEQIDKLKTALSKAGLELTDNRKHILIEKIKAVVLEMLDYSGTALKTNFSYYLSKKLSLDYTYLANVFSEGQGITIEHYIISNKIRKVKELICYNELNLTEISWKLNYSSVAHLSTQFKKVTGVTPSRFKHIECNNPLRPSMCEL